MTRPARTARLISASEMFDSEEEKGRKQNRGNTRDAQLPLCSVSLGVSCHPPALSLQAEKAKQFIHWESG